MLPSNNCIFSLKPIPRKYVFHLCSNQIVRWALLCKPGVSGPISSISYGNHLKMQAGPEHSVLVARKSQKRRKEMSGPKKSKISMFFVFLFDMFAHVTRRTTIFKMTTVLGDHQAV